MALIPHHAPGPYVGHYYHPYYHQPHFQPYYHHPHFHPHYHPYYHPYGYGPVIPYGGWPREEEEVLEYRKK